MELNHFQQQPGHLPEKSTTMWTTPTTPEQKRYFSKHAPKRRVYGLIMTALQGLHGFLAFAAWYSIFAWAFSGIDVLKPFAGYLAATLLIVFHALFRVTWDTFWYDKLDQDDRTDSSPWIPLIILAVLLITEANGARIFLQNQVQPAATKTTDQADGYRTAAAGMAKAEYNTQVKQIESVFAEKARAAELPYKNRIAQLRRRSIDSDSERKYVYNQIAAQERLRDQALAPIASAKAAQLEAALKAYQENTTGIKARHSNLVSQIDQHNTAEASRVQSEMQSAKSSSWIISLLLISLIAALGYARVRINVNSGILPKRNFTVLDAHGSVVERIATALSDAFNRRSLQLAVWFHKVLSPRTEITSFDGTVVARPGTYNTPTGVFTAHNTPAPPQDSQVLGEAYEKVWKKIQAIQQDYPGYAPERDVLNHELTKALSMNGTYATSDWDDPSLGK